MRAAFVDPGGDLPRLKAAAQQAGVTIEKILLTHEHIDHCGSAGIFAEELHVSLEIASAVIGQIHLRRRAHVEEEGVLRPRYGELLERRQFVENPDAAPVRGQDHRVVARVQRDLVNRHGRQIGLHSHPLFAAVERDVEAALGSEVEHVGIFQVFCDCSRNFSVWASRQIAGD